MKKLLLSLLVILFASPAFATAARPPSEPTYWKIYDLLIEELNSDFWWTSITIGAVTFIFAIASVVTYVSFKNKAELEIKEVKIRSGEEIGRLRELADNQKQYFEKQESNLFEAIRSSKEELEKKIKSAESNFNIRTKLTESKIELSSARADHKIFLSGLISEAKTLLNAKKIDRAKTFLEYLKGQQAYLNEYNIDDVFSSLGDIYKALSEQNKPEKEKWQLKEKEIYKVMDMKMKLKNLKKN